MVFQLLWWDLEAFPGQMRYIIPQRVLGLPRGHPYKSDFLGKTSNKKVPRRNLDKTPETPQLASFKTEAVWGWARPLYRGNPFRLPVFVMSSFESPLKAHDHRWVLEESHNIWRGNRSVHGYLYCGGCAAQSDMHSGIEQLTSEWITAATPSHFLYQCAAEFLLGNVFLFCFLQHNHRLYQYWSR